MTQVFPYLVTALSEVPFESTLAKEVFPKVEILRRNVRGTRHELRKLGTRNGHAEYLWRIEADLVAGTTEPPTLSELEEALGSLGTVTGPVASVTVDVDKLEAIIDPNLVKVTVGGPMVWSFLEVPPGYKPYVDFVRFRPALGAALTESFAPPFEELTLGSWMVTGARAAGPVGHYWYKVSLVPDRRTGEGKVVRLECDPESYYEGRDGAGVEVSDPPAHR